MKILVPVDGSELSIKAVRHSVKLVRQGLRASLVLLNVQEPATLYEMVTAPDAEMLARVGAEAGIDMLQEAEALAVEADVAYEREVVRGDPAHMIVEVAERFHCGLVVMGSHGAGALQHALLGSVSQEVLRACPVPVMYVKLGEP